MKNFAIITKKVKIDISAFGEISSIDTSNKIIVWRFLGIPFFRETVEINQNA